MASTTTNEALVEQHHCSYAHSGQGHRDRCGSSCSFINRSCNYHECMRCAGYIHLLLAAFFFADNLVHMFFFPYLTFTVPIRIASGLLVLFNLLLALLAFGAVKGQSKNAGKAGTYFNYYMLLNLIAAMIVFFLLLIAKIEAIHMLAARLTYFWAEERRRTMIDLETTYAQHPLWAHCACYTILCFVFVAHLIFGKTACNAKHQHPYQPLTQHGVGK